MAVVRQERAFAVKGARTVRDRIRRSVPSDRRRLYRSGCSNLHLAERDSGRRDVYTSLFRPWDKPHVRNQHVRDHSVCLNNMCGRLHTMMAFVTVFLRRLVLIVLAAAVL